MPLRNRSHDSAGSKPALAPVAPGRLRDGLPGTQCLIASALTPIYGNRTKIGGPGMIDSVGLEIPISAAAAAKIKGQASRWRHIDECHDGVVLEVWSAVEAEVEGSWSRSIGCRVLDRSHHMDYPCCLRFASFSLCKFVMGENVHLLYGWERAIGAFDDAVRRAFDLVGPDDIAESKHWRVTRLDLCYSWQVGERAGHQLIEWAKGSSYARKKVSTYETSVLWVGSSYSCKLYCKGPEFKAHDLPALLKADAMGLDKVRGLEALASGIIRFEAGLRGRYLSACFEKRFVLVQDLTVEWMGEKLTYFLRRWAMGLRSEVWEFEDCLERIQQHFGARGTPRAQAKACQMAGFYSLLFRLGPARLRARMASSTFYRSVADLRAADVVLVGLDDLPEDLAALRFEVPSDLAPNVADELELWRVAV